MVIAGAKAAEDEEDAPAVALEARELADDATLAAELLRPELTDEAADAADSEALEAPELAEPEADDTAPAAVDAADSALLTAAPVVIVLVNAAPFDVPTVTIPKTVRDAEMTLVTTEPLDSVMTDVEAPSVAIALAAPAAPAAPLEAPLAADEAPDEAAEAPEEASAAMVLVPAVTAGRLEATAARC